MDSKNIIKKNANDVIEKKIVFFQDIIQKTYIQLNKNKLYGVLSNNEINTCILSLKELSDTLKNMRDKNCETDTETMIQCLQTINNDLSGIMKNYGTQSLEDLISICYGIQSNNTMYSNEFEKNKYELLKKYFHPTNYKLTNTINKKVKKDKFEKVPIHLECQDISTFATDFHSKIFGIKLYLVNESQNKQMVIYGILDDVILDFMNDKYIHSMKNEIFQNLHAEDFSQDEFRHFVKYLSLKDYLIFDSKEIYQKYIGSISQYNLLKQKSLQQTIKDFITGDLFSKRNVILLLLMHSNKKTPVLNSVVDSSKNEDKNTNYENKYIAYLLYDLLSNENNGAVDSHEQVTLLDSLPYHGKEGFRDAMKKTIQYTQELTNFDMNKIPLEQQICLLKVNDAVKEKAIMKLKEVKSKSDDSGSKARQYLDGLLKIPFQIYKKEPILFVMDESKELFKELVDQIVCFLSSNVYSHSPYLNDISCVPPKSKYTNMEIVFYLTKIKECIKKHEFQILEELKNSLTKGDKKELIQNIQQFDEFKTQDVLSLNKKTKSFLKEKIVYLLNHLDHSYKNIPQLLSLENVKNNILKIDEKMKCMSDYMVEIRDTLNKSVYGHKNAKKQIERIIGQWMNGEQGGYCFGFEGPPGVGKTSLAKRGLSNCLKDENGESRPFAMIQMGGDSNGSSLHGHNYTYVGSSWGGIVQILIDKKCMNPIIFIDEIDKISKTEHGKEIVGILIHLLDSTQNDCFQDKYFSGVELDLSKALFVLSYNDIDQIDRILLDRIHRVKFNHLSLEDKLVICKNHILPEVFEKMGLQDMILFSDKVLEFIIEEYTCEAGVRKLKEVLFEIVGEINLELLNSSLYGFHETTCENDSTIKEIPLVITKENIKNKYFREKREIQVQKIHEEPQIGIMNGLWANDLGLGGTLPIQAKYFPCSQFLELKLTGMVGDVMKESANVALSIAWNLTTCEKQQGVIKKYSANKEYIHGIHVHFPDGSTHKNGPSGGSCLTTVLYSLLNDKKIRHDVAMTGEISLDCKITAIGGLDLKILGGIKGGVKTFIYPEENKRDFEKFMEKYGNADVVKGIEFISVKRIEEVFSLVFAE
jgi:ATP-dependent Lon protease